MYLRYSVAYSWFQDFYQWQIQGGGWCQGVSGPHPHSRKCLLKQGIVAYFEFGNHIFFYFGTPHCLLSEAEYLTMKPIHKVLRSPGWYDFEEVPWYLVGNIFIIPWSMHFRVDKEPFCAGHATNAGCCCPASISPIIWYGCRMWTSKRSLFRLIWFHL